MLLSYQATITHTQCAISHIEDAVKLTLTESSFVIRNLHASQLASFKYLH